MKKGNGESQVEEVHEVETVAKEVKLRTTNKKEFLKYDFLREEKEGMGLELAQQHNELSQKESGKKAVVKAFDSEIATIESEISELATKLNNGHEYRNIDVQITFDYESRKKAYTRLDTGEKYKEVPMTSDELQVPLPIEEELEETATDMQDEVDA